MSLPSNYLRLMLILVGVSLTLQKLAKGKLDSLEK